MHLERENFHVVYFESHIDLEMSDVDVSDILLAILHRVSESLERSNIDLRPTYFQTLFEEVQSIFSNPIRISEVKLSLGIAEITAQTQASPQARSNLRRHLEPRMSRILKEINSEVLRPAIRKLKERGKAGLVVIVDSLDRIDNVTKPWGSLQHEYLFIERGAQLKSLDCHLVYTMPLSLRFSNEYFALSQRFSVPKILPMVKLKLRNGQDHKQGMEKLRSMVLARAFPYIREEDRHQNTLDVFEDHETLDHLCRVSGGHVRNLLRLLNTSIQKEMKLPITRRTLDAVVVEQRSERSLAIEPKEWDLLKKVVKSKRVAGNDEYNVLLRSMFVYEYRDDSGIWFDINPILSDAEELRND
jgi:hypothetical protein